MPEGLESLLLPLRLPELFDNHEDKNIFNDYYKDAVKYLQHALHSTPPVLVALQIQVSICFSKERTLSVFDFCENVHANFVVFLLEFYINVLATISLIFLLRKKAICLKGGI